MRILFTILGYAWWSGSETHVRDLAIGLARRGHSVTIFAPTLGEMAFETRRLGIGVTDTIAELKVPPDVIHGNHVIPLAEALLAFPQTPALWTCHDWLAWHDEPPLFPQILRYAAVDEICSQRILSAGVEPNRLMLLPNGVDLRRIPERPRQLSSRPLSAAIFGKANAIAPVIREACRQLDIVVCSVGGNDSPKEPEPEKALVHHDLVFATARAASEAIACGCAVVLVDARGFGGLVTSANYEKLRSSNFGLACLNDTATVDVIAASVREYDPIDAASVSFRHRAERSIERVLDVVETCYAEILAEPLPSDRIAFDRSLAVYLRQFTPHASPDSIWPWYRERAGLLAELAALREELGNERTSSATQRAFAANVQKAQARQRRWRIQFPKAWHSLTKSRR